MESEMIFILFGMNESEKKVIGKINTYFVNDTNIPTLKVNFQKTYIIIITSRRKKMNVERNNNHV
jgi:hypothetical protein